MNIDKAVFLLRTAQHGGSGNNYLELCIFRKKIDVEDNEMKF